MDLTFTLADLTATSACEMRLYTELRERAQKQSARPTHEKLERAREAYRECLRVLTAGGMVGSGVAGSGELAVSMRAAQRARCPWWRPPRRG